VPKVTFESIMRAISAGSWRAAKRVARWKTTAG